MKTYLLALTLLLTSCTEHRDEITPEPLPDPIWSMYEPYFYFPGYTVVPKPVVPYSQKDLKCLAENMYHEARGEGRRGMLLVGHTTVNRAKSKRFPNTICKVVYQPSQFSWTKHKKTISEKRAYEKAKKLAKKVLHRKKDTSFGSVYFYNPHVAAPAWAKRRTHTVTHGNHRFMR